ncbi:uncharacterized protein BKCO1_1000486 [Diplodia corticola]|uniref:Uncharacterized protein n=1 Tax=Diplodia corticola TaxID=236234 RepID=A0A1J9RJJ4_9PEZI|nr:uncharacterized protein BKCO1_1000486 [Diplodia corticola]OJD40641.1 hypothetical protein BKCO1_1000486 [Diplodia corticola]
MASNHPEIPPMDEELKRLMVPAACDWATDDNVAQDPNRRSIFPEFDSLPRDQMLLSEEEAEAYLQSFRRQPYPDATVVQVHANVLKYVEDIYTSIVDCRYALDLENSRDFSRLVEPYKSGTYYPTKLILAMSWNLMNLLLDGADNGFMRTIRDDQKGNNNDEENSITLVERHRRLCITLLLEKVTVEDVLSGDDFKLRNLIYSPTTYASLKAVHRFVNTKRRNKEPKPVPPHTWATPPPGTLHQLAIQNNRSPMYPAFVSIPPADQLPDMPSALQHLSSLQPRLPRSTNPHAARHLALLQANKLPLVIALYTALRDVTSMQNAPASIDARRFALALAAPHTNSTTAPPAGPSASRPPPTCTPTDLLAAAWRVLTAFLRGATHGFPQPFPKEFTSRNRPSSLSLLRDAGRQVSAPCRLASMLAVLRREKSVAWMWVKSDFALDGFVADPYAWSGVRSDVRVTSGWRRAKPLGRRHVRIAAEGEGEGDGGAVPMRSGRRGKRVAVDVGTGAGGTTATGGADGTEELSATGLHEDDRDRASGCADGSEWLLTRPVYLNAPPLTDDSDDGLLIDAQWHWDALFDPENNQAYPPWTAGLDIATGQPLPDLSEAAGPEAAYAQIVWGGQLPSINTGADFQQQMLYDGSLTSPLFGLQEGLQETQPQRAVGFEDLQMWMDSAEDAPQTMEAPHQLPVWTDVSPLNVEADLPSQEMEPMDDDELMGEYTTFLESVDWQGEISLDAEIDDVMEE